MEKLETDPHIYEIWYFSKIALQVTGEMMIINNTVGW